MTQPQRPPVKLVQAAPQQARGGDGALVSSEDGQPRPAETLSARRLSRRWTPADERAGRPARWLSILVFLLVVGLPTALAAVYYGFIASSQYATEIQFGVRSADAQRNDATSIFQGMASASQIGLQSNIVVKYIKSRSMVDAISQKIDLRKMFSGPEVDEFSRLDPHTSVEGLVDYWRGKVEPYFELTTGIVSVQIRAFTPEDALTIGRNVLALSENLADDLSKRARADYVKFAQEQVEEASEKLRQARQAMLEFRDRERSIDPNKEADSARLGISKLRDELGRVRADYLTARGRTGENSTVLVSLRNRMTALESLIHDAEARMTGTESKEALPISQNIRGFENVEIERQLAEKFYDAAMQSLQRAQFEASRRAMYLEVFVTPSLAEHPVYPRRLVSVLIVALASFGAWIFLLMIYYSIRDHV
ncbi:hypothetical protein [Reyranella sp.]|uniref:hypothetical protein n=1 Tax=Reyranella sp. TaxID=1929291 RepID=UPI003F6EF10F